MIQDFPSRSNEAKSHLYLSPTGCVNQKLWAIHDTTDHQEQRRRRGKKVAQRVSAGKGSTMMTSAGGAAQGRLPSRGGHRICIAPPGLEILFAAYPGLTPWATFLTRLRRCATWFAAIWIARCLTRTFWKGYEFTRAVKLQENLGFSPCRRKCQGLKARLLAPYTARVNSCPDTCLAPLQILLPRAMVLA